MAKPEFRFVPLAEHHLPLLFGWLNRSHVAKWWDGPVSSAEVRAKYLPRLSSTSVSPYIAFLNEAPAGFIQSYVAAEQDDDWWPGERDPGVVGTDQFLADSDSLGRGLGTEMLGQFVRLQFENPAVTSIQTDPSPNNIRAIRCYEKVGFRKLGVLETPRGPTLLMVLSRAAV